MLHHSNRLLLSCGYLLSSFFCLQLFSMPVAYTSFSLVHNKCMYPSVMGMHGCALLGGFVCFMCSPLFLWVQFLADGCFVCKSLQFPLLIVKSYKSVKWHLRFREIFHLLRMQQIVTNILVASAIGKKPALEQKMQMGFQTIWCCCAHSFSH